MMGAATLSGRRSRLRAATVAVDKSGGNALAVTIPAGAVVEVVRGPGPGQKFLDISWDGRPLGLFLADLKLRGEDVTDQRAGA
jgi:hypothetical protein